MADPVQTVRRKVVGGPWDGRVIETPVLGPAFLRVPAVAPDHAADSIERGEGLATAAGLSREVEYDLCVLRFPTCRIEVWHPAGTEIAATVAHMAHGYVAERDLKMILARNEGLARENTDLREALDGLLNRITEGAAAHGLAVPALDS